MCATHPEKEQQSSVQQEHLRVKVYIGKTGCGEQPAQAPVDMVQGAHPVSGPTGLHVSPPQDGLGHYKLTLWGGIHSPHEVPGACTGPGITQLKMTTK